MHDSLLHLILLTISSGIADLDRIPAVSHRGCLRREIEKGRETEIGRGTEKEIVTVIVIVIANATANANAIVTVIVIVTVTVTATATEIASGIEIATYCPDIDHRSDHLRGTFRFTTILGGSKRHPRCTS